MDIDVITAGLIIAVSFGLVVSRTYVAFVTLALCGGYVLREFIALDLTNQLNQNLNTDFPVASLVELGLLILPALLVAYRFRKSQGSAGRFIQQLIPSIALSLFALVIVYQSLPVDFQTQLSETSYIYTNVIQVRTFLVVFALATALFDVLVQHAEPPQKKRKK